MAQERDSELLELIGQRTITEALFKASLTGTNFDFSEAELYYFDPEIEQVSPRMYEVMDAIVEDVGFKRDGLARRLEQLNGRYLDLVAPIRQESTTVPTYKIR